MNAEVFLKMLRSRWEYKAGEIRQAILQNDMVKVQLALGGQLAVEEVERDVKLFLEQLGRRLQEQTLKERKRILRDRQRQLFKVPESKAVGQ